MTIEKNLNGTELTVTVTGRLDTTTAPQLESELKSSLDGIEELAMDFTGLDYLSSAGLRVLLSLHKIMMKKGSMKLVNVNEEVCDVFEVTGFDEILTYEKGA